MMAAAIIGTLGLGVLGVSAWLHVHEKDGSGWGLVALILIVTSCSKAGG